MAGSYLLSGTSSIDAQFGDLLIIGGAFFWASHILLIQHALEKIATVSVICLSITCDGHCCRRDYGSAGVPAIARFSPDVATTSFCRYGGGDGSRYGSWPSVTLNGGGGDIVVRVGFCHFWLASVNNCLPSPLAAVC